MQMIYHPKVREFIDQLEDQTYAKVFRITDRLQQYGHRLIMPHAKHIEPRLWELRIRGQQEVRLFYTFRYDEILVLHGFVKKSMQIPRRELDIAHLRLDAVDSR